MPDLRENIDELNRDIADRLFPEVYEMEQTGTCTYYTLSLLSPQTDLRSLTDQQFYEFKKSMLVASLLLHQMGLVYRDWSPRNCLFDETTRSFRVIDFEEVIPVNSRVEDPGQFRYQHSDTDSSFGYDF